MEKIANNPLNQRDSKRKTSLGVHNCSSLCLFQGVHIIVPYASFMVSTSEVKEDTA
jgi:hypothetical protein